MAGVEQDKNPKLFVRTIIYGVKKMEEIPLGIKERTIKMSGDIRNITKEQRYTDKRILDSIKHYLKMNYHKVVSNADLSMIYSMISEGRKSKEKYLEMQKIDKQI